MLYCSWYCCCFSSCHNVLLVLLLLFLLVVRSKSQASNHTSKPSKARTLNAPTKERHQPRLSSFAVAAAFFYCIIFFLPVRRHSPDCSRDYPPHGGMSSRRGSIRCAALRVWSMWQCHDNWHRLQLVPPMGAMAVHPHCC